MAKRRLTVRQQAFINAMNRGAPNATAAARAAGYSAKGISYAASRLRAHPKIKPKLRPPQINLRWAMQVMKQAYGTPPKPKPTRDARQELNRLERELAKLLRVTK
jgi:phage terminase small subunit